MTLRKELRNQLTERFIPELSRIGFVGPDKISGNCIIHEFKRTNSKVTQILDIQFEKYGLARFGKSWGQPAWFLISFSSWKSKKQKGQKQASDACKSECGERSSEKVLGTQDLIGNQGVSVVERDDSSVYQQH